MAVLTLFCQNQGYSIGRDILHHGMSKVKTMSPRMLHLGTKGKLPIFRSLKAGKYMMGGPSVFKAKYSTGIGTGTGTGVGKGVPFGMGMDIGMEGKLGVFMDLDSCRLPTGIPSEETMNSIRRYLCVHGYPRIDSCIAYGVGSCYNTHSDGSIGKENVEFVELPFRSLEGEQPVEVTLKMVKESALIEIAILVDMGAFALDNRPPCTILICSGKFEYIPILRKLEAQGYTILTAVPDLKTADSDFISCSQSVWEWSEMISCGGIFLGPTFNFKI